MIQFPFQKETDVTERYCHKETISLGGKVIAQMNLPVFSISRTHSLYMFLRTDKSISYVMLLNGQNNRGNVSSLLGFINNTQAHTCSDTIFSTPLIATYMPHFIALSMIPQQNYGKIIVKVTKITPLAHPINSSLPRRGLRSRHNFYFNPMSERWPCFLKTWLLVPGIPKL